MKSVLVNPAKTLRRIQRNKNWKRQIQTGQNSLQFGLPRVVCRNIFEYTSWEGVAGTIEIERFHERNLRHYPLPKTLSAQRHYELDRRASHWDNEAYVTKLDGGRVISPFQSIVTKDDAYLEEESYEFHSYDVWDRGFYATQTSLPKVTHIEGTVAHCGAYGDGGNIFHFVHNALPRLALIQKSRWSNEIDHYLLSTDKFGFIKDLVSLVGIDEEKLLFGNQHQHIQAKSLLVASHPDQLGQMDQWGIELSRELILANLAEPNHKKKIYISRSTASQRRLLNEDELIKQLIPLGFQVVLMDKLSVKEQAETMRDAEAVIGIHGANLTFCHLLAEGTPFVELFPASYVVSCYYQLASHAKAKYAYVLGDGKAPTDLTDLRLTSSDDFTVDIDTVLRTYQAVLSTVEPNAATLL